ncbi:MAG: CHAT domain-containing tetratricopeptide repeat protein [Bacteroidota bacterium]
MRVQFTCIFFLFCLMPAFAVFSQDTTQAHVFVQKGKMMEEANSYDSASYFFQQAQLVFHELANRQNDSFLRIREIQLERLRLSLRIKQKQYLAAEKGFRSLLDKLEHNGLHSHIEAGICQYYIGFSLYSVRKYPEAKEAFLLAKQLLEKELPITNFHHGDCFIQLGLIAKRERDFRTAMQYFHALLGIPLGISDDTDHLLVKAYGNIGLTYYNLNDLDSSILSLEKVLEILGDKEGQRSLENQAKTLANIGVLYKNRGRFREAIRYYQRAEQIFVLLEDTSQRHSIVDNLGEAYKYIGEYEKSISYLLEAIAFASTNNGPSHVGLIRLFSNLAEAYLAKGDVLQALQYYQQGLAIFDQHYDRSSYRGAVIFYGLGDCYLAKKEFDKAQYWYTRLLENARKERGENSMEVAFSCAYLGKFYLKRKDYQQSLDYYKKALQIQSIYLDSSDYDIGISYHYMGANYTYLQQCEKADSCFRIAEKIFDSPKLDLQQDRILNSYNRAISMLKCGQDEGAVYRYFQPSIPLITELSYSYEETSSKIFLQHNFHNDFLLIAQLAHRLHRAEPDSGYDHKTFFYAEKMKAITLLQQMTEAEANVNSKIPKNLQLLEADLREKRTSLESRLYIVRNQSVEQDSIRILALQRHLFRINRSYDSLIQIFEQQYPFYYQLKYDIQIASVPEIQQQLKEDQALLEYMIGDTIILGMLILPDTFLVNEIPKDSLLDKNLDAYRMALPSCPPGFSRECSPHESAQRRGQLGNYLYQQLILPLREFLPRRLVIVPDGILGFIPFETLITEEIPDPDQASKWQYLLEDYDMSYAVSATIWLNMKQQSHSRFFSRPLLAFAPEFGADSTRFSQDRSSLQQRGHLFGPLRNQEEVIKIQELIGGDIWLTTEATVEAFMAHSGDYRIVHLATHGKMSENPQFSFLAFYGPDDSIVSQGMIHKNVQALYVADLYNLTLKADLVVLSACETGVGKLYKGEGIASLAQGFTYAGAKSLVSTLWSVNDATTTALMERFYTYLADGWPKDKALRQAKKDLIAEGYQHPYYWAGYILMGDSEPIDLSLLTGKWIIGIFSICLLLLMFVVRIRQTRTKESL